jgi:hypothetical protein
MNSQMLNPCSPIRYSKIQSNRNSSTGTERIDYPTFYGHSEVEKYHNLTFFRSEESDLKLPKSRIVNLSHMVQTNISHFSQHE